MSYTPSSVKDAPFTDSTNLRVGLDSNGFHFYFLFYAKPGVFQHHQLLNGMKEGRNQITDQQFIPGIYQISATKFVQSLQTTTFDPSHCSACRPNLFVVARTHRIQYVSVSLPSHDIHHQQIRRKNEENAIKRAFNTDIHPVDARRFI